MIASGSFNAQRRSDARCQGKTSRSATPDIEPQIDPRRFMTDSEVIMLDAIQGNQLIVYRKAIEAAGDAISLAKRVPAPLRSIADQVIRSASSVPPILRKETGVSAETTLENRLRLRKRGRLPSSPPGRCRRDQSQPRGCHAAALRRGPGNDLAVAQPEAISSSFENGIPDPPAPAGRGIL